MIFQKLALKLIELLPNRKSTIHPSLREAYFSKGVRLDSTEIIRGGKKNNGQLRRKYVFS